MVAIPLQSLIFVLLLVLMGATYLAIRVDRRRFRHALWKQTGAEPQQMALALDAAPFGLALLDLQNRSVYTNPYAQRLWAAQPTAVGEPWTAVLNQDIATVRSRGLYETLYRVLTLPDGHSWNWWICVLPQMTLLFLADLSEQRRQEEASRMFLGTLSHELRTPLTAVLAHLDIVRKRQVDAQTRTESLAIAHQEMHRLVNLVQNMVQLGRLEMSVQLEKRPLDLLMVVETAVAELLLNAEAKNIVISLEAPAPLPLITGDADKLRQVFLNVIENSVKYCRGGDHISVCLTPGTGGIHVTIQDTGPGIAPEHLPYVTQRLYRVRKETEGSGLGLSIAAEIVRLHQAQLKIESANTNNKTGVTVSFVLPANKPLN